MKERAKKDAPAKRTPSQNYAALVDWLAALRRRWRAAMLLRGLMLLVAISAGSLLALLAGDNLVHLPAWFRFCALAAFVASFVAGCVFFVIRPLVLRLPDECVAARAEKLHPSLGNAVINAILLHKAQLGPVERTLADAQLAEAAAAIAATPPHNPPDWRAARIPAAAAAASASLLLIYSAVLPESFENALARLIKPWEFIPPLTDTRLDVSPGDVEILAGESLIVEAVPKGVIPQEAFIIVKHTGREKKEKMDFEGGAFIFQFSALAAPFSYRIQAGDAATKHYRVAIKPRPFIKSIKLTLQYPDYLSLPPAEQSGADIQAVIGTEAVLSIAADIPISSAVIRLKPERPVAQAQPPTEDADADSQELHMTLTGPREAAARFHIVQSGTYHVEVADRTGTPSPAVIHNIIALPDNPPRCEITLPGRDASIRPDQRLAVHARAADDYGVRSLALLVSEDGDKWRPLASRDYSPGIRLVNEAFEIDPAALGL